MKTSSDIAISLLIDLVRRQGNHLLGYRLDELAMMIGQEHLTEELVERLGRAFSYLPHGVEVVMNKRIISVEDLRRLLLNAQMIPEASVMVELLD